MKKESNYKQAKVEVLGDLQDFDKLPKYQQVHFSNALMDAVWLWKERRENEIKREND